MNKKIDMSVVVPELVLLKVERLGGYGSVPGLDDEELAAPEELERMVYKQEFGPILALSVMAEKSWIKPNIDGDGDVDWGAFGTVDFDRYSNFDKAKYKADKLWEQLKDLMIRISILNERIPGKAKYKVLRLAGKGIIDVEDISDWDVWQLAKLYMRALRLRKQVTELREASRRRKERRVEAWLDSLG